MKRMKRLTSKKFKIILLLTACIFLVISSTVMAEIRIKGSDKKIDISHEGKLHQLEICNYTDGWTVSDVFVSIYNVYKDDPEVKVEVEVPKIKEMMIFFFILIKKLSDCRDCHSYKEDIVSL